MFYLLPGICPVFFCNSRNILKHPVSKQHKKQNTMKSSMFLLLLIACLSAASVNAAPAYPFQVKKEGKGKQHIIFIPGFASSGDVWQETVNAYTKNFTCHVLTMPGFAGVPPQDAPSLDNWIKSIAAYIQEQRLGKPIIVGHSMGGGMAMMLAAGYPDLIGKIVVVDALPCLAAMGNPSFKSNPQPDCNAFVGQFTSMPDSVFLKMQKRNIPALIADTVHRKEVISWGVRSDRKTFAVLYCQFSNLDMRDTIAHITCPALVLLEAPFSGIKPVITAQYSKLAGARLEYATSGLHFLMYDDRQWYMDQLAQFIKQQ